MDRFKLTKQDRINQYKIIMYNVKGDLECYTRPNIVRRLDKMGFFDAPASINHHGAYSGALFDHSLAVTGALLDYTDKMGLTWSDARSPYIVGMFHDLCKCDNYKVVDGKWKYNPNMILPGHGEKSIIMLQNIAPDALTNEEIACIRWHMGAFDDRNNWEYYTRAVAKFPNVMYTRGRYGGGIHCGGVSMKWVLLELLFIAVQLIGFIPFYFIWRKDCKEIGKEHLAVSLKERFWAWCLSFPFWLFPIIYLARYNK